MTRLLILSKHPADYERLVRAALPGLEIVTASEVADGIAHGGASEVLLADPQRAREAIAQLPSIRWVQLTWAGVEPMLEPSLGRGYFLTNVRGVFGPLMTEYVFAYLLAHERRVLTRYRAQQDGRWEATPPGSLRGKRLGLMGVGSIGAEVARTGKHFGMEVRGYTRSSAESPHVDAYFHEPDRLAFADGLDYLVSLLPNTGPTRKLVDAALLARLPAHAVFINAGRGSVVDDDALAEALGAGRLAGAVLDVFCDEPLPAEHVFWRTPNLLITSHTAAPSVAADVVSVFLDNYRRFVRGEPLHHLVDVERGY